MYQQTQSQAMRMKMRNNIRDKHIRQIFSQQRKKSLAAERKNNMENNINGNNASAKSFYSNNCANEEMNMSKLWQIQSILFNKNNDEYMWGIGSSQFSDESGDRNALRENQLNEVWHIVINCKEPCLSETSILVLINGAIKDINQIISMSQYKERQNEERRRELCVRICKFIWILSSQTYQNENINERIAIKIGQTCLTVIDHEFKNNKNKASFIWDQNQNRYRSKAVSEKYVFTEFDEYIIGFCAIALGNICKNATIVKQILKEFKLSDLIQILNLFLDNKNFQDLTVFVTNILLYYPEFQFYPITGSSEQHQQNVQSSKTSNIRMMLRYKEEKLELSFVLEYIYQKIRQDFLLYLHHLNQGQNNFHSPYVIKSQPNSKSNKKSHQVDKSAKNMHKNWQQFNMEQEKQIRRLLKKTEVIKREKNEDKNQNQNEENSLSDLISCAHKIEYLLIEMKQKEQNMRQKKGDVPTNLIVFDKLWAQNKDAVQMNQLTQSINKIGLRIYYIKQDILNYSFRILTANYKINQIIFECRNKGQIIKNHLLKNKRIIQIITFVQVMLSSIHWTDIKQQRMNKSTQRIMGQTMGWKSINNLFDQIHCFVVSYDNITWDTTNRQQIMEYENHQMSMNKVIWQIYQYLMNLIDYKVNNLIENDELKNWKNMMNKQLEWLEMKLFTKISPKDREQLALEQQQKIVSLLVKFYPIINVNFNANQSSPYEHVDIQMQKLRNINDLLHCKLIEHRQTASLFYSILLAINCIVNKIYAAIRVEAQFQMMDNQTDKLNIREILGQKLHDQLKQLSSNYDSSGTQNESLNSSICDIIDEILGLKPELIQQQQKISEQVQCTEKIDTFKEQKRPNQQFQSYM